MEKVLQEIIGSLVENKGLDDRRHHVAQGVS
jgi:hypothetical protein